MKAKDLFVCKFTTTRTFFRENISGDAVQAIISKAIYENLPDTFQYVIKQCDEKVLNEVAQLEKLIEATCVLDFDKLYSLKFFNSSVNTKSIEVIVNFINKSSANSNWTVNFNLTSEDYTVLSINEKYVELVKGNLLAFESLEKQIIKLPKLEYDNLDKIIISTLS